MKIIIEGYSDDNFEVRAITSAGKERGDEVGCSAIGWCKIGDEKTGGLLVFAEYAPSYISSASWALTATTLGEPDDQPRGRSEIVPWPVTIDSGDYGPRVVIEAPDDVPLEYGDGNEVLDAAKRLRESEMRKQAESDRIAREREQRRNQYEKLRAEFEPKR